ncbi:MAG TPA: hypothetical protein VD788_03005 [Candidatus Polarisedimenticolaceae bacterium]|nr:hypothetical protein [Candidatus Polarisedimenticolaceae bacterium]
MQRMISFHPVDLRFFDETIGPLIAGGKVNPQPFVDAAMRFRQSEWHARRYRKRLEQLLATLEPPPPPSEGSVWTKLRSRLEQFDFKADPRARRLEGKVEPELHLWGRPFLILESSAERVSASIEDYLDAEGDASLDALVVQQLLRIDPALPAEIEPAQIRELDAELSYRNELLETLKSIHSLARTARGGEQGVALAAPGELALEQLCREVPWRAVWLHSRAVPFWVARDVDGLETVCHSAGVTPPDVLTPCWRLFADAIESFPELRDSLNAELRYDKDLGGFVAPADVPELSAFLNREGARIIQAATREGVGPLCASMLRKIRECAHHAQRSELGYLEASGIMPVAYDREEDDAETAGVD